MSTPGTLDDGEFHPSAHIAMQYIRQHLIRYNVFTLKEVLGSTALSGSRVSEIALETLERILDKQPVSDRYVMGLAWLLWDIENRTEAKQKSANERGRN